MLTYKLLIDAKGKSNDITGMEKIVETIQAKGIGSDKRMQCLLATYYATAGMKDKAKSVLKEVEGGDLEQNRWVVPSLLPLYAIGEAEKIVQLWKVCEVNPRVSECIAAIKAWGELKNLVAAEALFKSLSKSAKLASKHYGALLLLYSSNEMLSKGIDLVKQMDESGCHVGPFTSNAASRFRWEVAKAERVAREKARANQLQQHLSSYQALMGQCAKSGDVHRAEKTLYRLRQLEYTGRSRPYQQLIQAYINGNVPAYGMRERLKGDNVVISYYMQEKLALIVAFKGTAPSYRLD